MGAGFFQELPREPLDVVTAAPRVDHLTDAGLVLEVELRVAGDARGEIGWQCDGFIQSIGMQ